MSTNDLTEEIDSDHEQEEVIDEFEKTTNDVRRLLPSIRKFKKVGFLLFNCVIM